MSSEIPEEVAEVIQKLNIIAGIPSGSKLNSIQGTYAAADSIIDNFWRWIGNESSEKSLDYINNTISDAVRISKKYKEWQGQIGYYVIQLEKAIINLTHVYRKEPVIIAKIEIIKLRITKEAFDKACETKACENKLSLSVTEPIPIPKIDTNDKKTAKSLPESKASSSDEQYAKIEINSFDSVSENATPKTTLQKKK